MAQPPDHVPKSPLTGVLGSSGSPRSSPRISPLVQAQTFDEHSSLLRNPPVIRPVSPIGGHGATSSGDSNHLHSSLRYLRAHSLNFEESSSLRSFTPVPGEFPDHGKRKIKPEMKSYWAYYIPAMAWIPHYSLSNLWGDLAAGLTLASFQIPIVMSYAQSLAHVQAVSGLYGLVLPPLIYAIMGSVPQMVVGPEAAISLVIGEAVSPVFAKSSLVGSLAAEKLTAEEIAAIITGSAGAVLLFAGLLRFGFLDSILSRPLLRGFISAVGVVMVIDQLPAELGLHRLMHEVEGNHPSTIGKLIFLYGHWRQTHALTAVIAFTALAILIIGRYAKAHVSKKYPRAALIPEILIVVIASTIICYSLDWHESGVDIVGNIKPGKIVVSLPVTFDKWPDFKQYFSASFFCALLGFFESTIAAKSLGSAFDINISTNRELVALGSVNLIASLFSSLPSFGGYGRSKINALSGAKTQMAGIVLAATTAICIAYFMSYFFYLPNCVLSSIISIVGLSLIEEAPQDIRFYWHMGGYEELLTLFLTLISTIFWSAQTGIAAGVGFSLVRVVHHATRPRIQILGRIPGTNIFRNADELPDNLEDVEGCLIVKIPEPLTFANTGDLRNRLRRLELYGSMRVHPSFPRIRHEEMTQHLIIDLKGMTECDSSAIQILHELVTNYVNRGITVMFTRMPVDRDIHKMFERSGITEAILMQNEGNGFFTSIEEALRYVDLVADDRPRSILST